MIPERLKQMIDEELDQLARNIQTCNNSLQMIDEMRQKREAYLKQQSELRQFLEENGVVTEKK